MASRRAPWLAALVGVCLMLPSLGNGLLLDDHILRLRSGGGLDLGGWEGESLNLFSMVPGNADARRQMSEAGTLPWWSPPELRLSFWRPVSSLTHRLDFRLWPERPWLMHLHSLVWLAALLLLVGLFYRRLLAVDAPEPRKLGERRAGLGGAAASAGWVAGLAAALYALDDAHAFASGWLANRNAIVATAFVGSMLLAHHAWRARGQRWGLWIGPAALAAALLSGEIALGGVAYLASYALFIDPARVRQRLLSLLPYVLVVVAWALLYRWYGYGAAGSDLYIDPLASPGRFGVAVAGRLPALLLGVVGLPPPALWTALPASGRLVYSVVALLVLTLLALLIWPLLRRERLARFFALGMVLAAIPVCATFPHERLLFVVGIGAMGLVALLIAHAGSLASEPHAVGRRLLRAAAPCCVVLHLLLSPALVPLKGAIQQRLTPLRQASLQIAAGPELAQQTLVVVHSPEAMLSNLIPIWRASSGASVPGRMAGLAVSIGAVDAWRPDARTLALEAPGGFLDTFMGGLFCSFAEPMPVGYRARRAGIDYQVTAATADGRPSGLRVRFPVPLEHPSLRWVTWRGSGFVDFTPPAPGQRTTLRQIDLVDLLLAGLADARQKDLAHKGPARLPDGLPELQAALRR